MKKIICIIWLLSNCLLFTECTEFVEDQLPQPDGDTLILIYSYLSPESDEIVVSVSETKSIFDPSLDTMLPLELIEEQFVIKDAVVELLNQEGETIQINYNSDRRRYIIPASSFSIEAGNTYILNVEAKGKRYTASCKIPDEKIDDIALSLVTSANDLFNSSRNLVVGFEDLADTKNYYIIGAEYEVESSDGSNFFYNVFFEEKYLSDSNRDGLLISDRGGVVNFDGDIEVFAKVTHVDPLIYETLKSNFLNSQASGGPFYQPIVPPTNIEGENGFGVFAGYRLTEKREVFTALK